MATSNTSIKYAILSAHNKWIDNEYLEMEIMTAGQLLAQRVQEYLEEGYELHGQPFCSPDGTIHQAMTQTNRSGSKR